jgi:sRNA-binding carbon storage regulator CsrA
VLKRDLRPGEELKIGDAIIKIVKKSGQIVSLAIDAPAEVRIEKIDTANDANLRKVGISAS